ncbi:MAG: xanthine dehydrogenase small subunit [Bacteroidales bacterium]|nr:xanthine dehydrogenase small subunit [Bacteroidales bacterium]MDZ4203615.1 xanthine dehydrogenase small subunit [Bacteroidales bacterium]
MNTGILKFVLDGQIVEIDFNKVGFLPSTTVLNYLRSLHGHKGTKEGCAEGDCGACTVVLGELVDEKIRYRSVDSCLLFLPAIHGKQLITVENLAIRNGRETLLHPVQQALVEQYGSQCGFCTPGIAMSLFALFKSDIEISRHNVIHALAGNLCRCTGYDSIYRAALQAYGNRQPDQFEEKEPETTKLLQQIHAEGISLEIKTIDQIYLLPSTLTEAIEIRASNPQARIINGATDTAIRQNKTHEFLLALLDISGVDELKVIRRENNGFYIGAGLSIESFKAFSEKEMPFLLPMFDVFASWQIRNVASIGGNLATASPIGDFIPLFIALNARLELINHQGKRWVGMENFITGYRQNCLEKNELLLGIHIPYAGQGVVFKTEKVSTRRDLDISTLSIAMRLELDTHNKVQDIILAYGGMADRPKRARHVEKFMMGKTWSKGNIQEARALIENDFTPISDARSGSEYRMAAAKNLLLKMLW